MTPGHFDIHDPSIPLIGEQCRVIGGFPTVMVQCGCEAQTILLIPGNRAVGTCPGCGSTWGVASFAFDTMQQTLSVNMAKIVVGATPGVRN